MQIRTIGVPLGQEKTTDSGANSVTSVQHWSAIESIVSWNPTEKCRLWLWGWASILIFFFFLSFFFKILFIYLSEREREREQGKEQRQRDKQTPCWAWSLLWGSISRPHNPEIMTWTKIKSQCSTDWATQAPQSWFSLTLVMEIHSSALRERDK